MTLAVGTRIGPYEVVSLLGAGGMGEVYRAHDTSLGRDVALKVLPDIFALDQDRLARFEREAHLLASLNHPRIAAIYGFEQAADRRCLVLELVEGETLADRLRGGPLPPEEALEFGRQIAEALETAHDKGIIHRDLKPANIKLTPDGTVKVLDFGLAKAFIDEANPADASRSPTLTAGTRDGVILGTAAYMSPEQARGGRVDRRTDVWAFGCVLYEMLTGKQTFAGDTVSDILAALLRSEPDWTRLPAATPPRVSELLHRALRKDPKRRIHDMADVRIELEEAQAGSAAGAVAAPVAHQRSRWLQALPWALPAAMTLAAGAAYLGGRRAGVAPPARVVRFTIPVPGGLAIGESDASAVAISPDGSRLVFAGRTNNGNQLFVKALAQPRAEPIPGTEGAASPFFSPDGQSIGFYNRDGRLLRIAVAGGAPQNLGGPLFGWPGASWGNDGSIFLALTPNTGLSRVAEGGGSAQTLSTPDPRKGEGGHYLPHVLPDGKAVLYTIEGEALKSQDDFRVAVRTLETGDTRILIEGGSDGRYLPTGHLVYGRKGALMGVPFDVVRLRVTGLPLLLQDEVMMDAVNGGVHFAVSDEGSLAYVPGKPLSILRRLVWVDRTGAVETLPAQAQPYLYPRLSPDGRRIAVEIRGPNDHLWVYEMSRDTLTRVTFEGENLMPLWLPDGSRLIFVHESSSGTNVSSMAADGSGAREELITGKDLVRSTSFSREAGAIAFWRFGAERDIWMLPLAGDRKPEPILANEADEHSGVFSPDSRWLAYVSNESGRPEVYVRAFHGPGNRTQISNSGGTEPVWARSGRELFYRNGDRLMAVAIDGRSQLAAGAPRAQFEGHYETGEWGANYDVAPDGRFLMVKSTEPEAVPTEVNVVLNWFEEVKQRLPAKSASNP